jgi:hypothetical protein
MLITGLMISWGIYVHLNGDFHYQSAGRIPLRLNSYGLERE